MNIKKIEKNGRRLLIYIKIPWYSSFKKMYNRIEKFLDKDASLDTSIDITGKYIVLKYLLRSKEDILPYIRFNNESNTRTI